MENVLRKHTRHKHIGMDVRPLLRTVVVGLVVLGLSACTEEGEMTYEEGEVVETAAAPNTLTEAERAAGWELLFDGTSFDGWTGLGREDIPTEHWVIQDGAIRKVPSGDVPTAPDGQPLAGGDLMTVDTYENFEFAFDWKVSPGANSGVKYNVSEEMSTANPPETAALGFEYQVLDDERHPDANQGVAGNRQAAGLYDMIAPGENKQMNPPGEWNQGRIVFRGNHVEHWLNGEKVVEYELDTPRFDSLLAASKYRDIEGFAEKRSGHIVLQDHNDEVWFRNLKIRELPADGMAEGGQPAASR